MLDTFDCSSITFVIIFFRSDSVNLKTFFNMNYFIINTSNNKKPLPYGRGQLITTDYFF